MCDVKSWLGHYAYKMASLYVAPRGDETVLSITQSLRTIRSLPLRLRQKSMMRGECYATKLSSL